MSPREAAPTTYKLPDCDPITSNLQIESESILCDFSITLMQRRGIQLGRFSNASGTMNEPLL